MYLHIYIYTDMRAHALHVSYVEVSTALSMEDRVDLVFCEVFDAGLLGETGPKLFRTRTGQAAYVVPHVFIVTIQR